MYKIKVYTIGKIKEDWLQEALNEYEGRLKSSLSFEWILAKNDEQLKQFLEKEDEFHLPRPPRQAVQQRGVFSFPP